MQKVREHCGPYIKGEPLAAQQETGAALQPTQDFNVVNLNDPPVGDIEFPRLIRLLRSKTNYENPVVVSGVAG